jgi:hypothetical protein
MPARLILGKNFELIKGAANNGLNASTLASFVKRYYARYCLVVTNATRCVSVGFAFFSQFFWLRKAL